MKRLIVIGIVLSFFVITNFAWAEKKTEKGASEQAYEHASDNAIFNRVSDWFATIGKPKEEKEKILAERKAKRAAKRAEKRVEKEVEKAEKKSEKETGRARKRIETRIEETTENFSVNKSIGSFGGGKSAGKGKNK